MISNIDVNGIRLNPMRPIKSVAMLREYVRQEALYLPHSDEARVSYRLNGKRRTMRL